MPHSLDDITRSGFFDRAWYVSRYSDLDFQDLTPEEHFLYHGAALRTNPGPLFDTGFYLDTYQDVRDSGVNPLIHYLTFGRAEDRLIRRAEALAEEAPEASNKDPLSNITRSGFFDRAWYVSRYSDLDFQDLTPEEHFLYHGAALRTNPGPLFDTGFYLDTYQDVRDSGVNPLIHYLTFGRAEDRLIRRAPEVSRAKPKDAVVQSAREDARTLVNKTALFDDAWYVARYNLDLNGSSARLHYVQYGAAQHYDPSPYFSTAGYYRDNPEARRSGVNALAHYLAGGHRDHHRPCPEFDAAWYAARLDGNLGPHELAIEHYLAHGDKFRPSPAIDSQWLSQAEAFQLGEFRNAIEFLRALEVTEPKLAQQIQRYGIAKPLDFDAFLADGLLVSPERLPQQIVDDAAAHIPADTRVSIIMPTWNRADVICRAIDSVLAQSWQQFELIIVDDGSTDDTAALIRACYETQLAAGQIVLIEQDNAGVCMARNTGLAAASGSVLAYLDSDNAWRPDALRVLLAGLFSRPDATSAYAGFLAHDTYNEVTRVQGAPFNRTQLLRSNFIDLNAFIHKRPADSTQLAFNETLTRLVDWELVLRLTRDAPPVFVPIVAVDYFIADGLGNITLTQPLQKNAEKVYALHRYEYFRAGLTAPQTLAVRYAQSPLETGETAKLTEMARANIPQPQPLSLAIVVDDDVADQFGDVLTPDAFWFANAMYRKTAQGYVPLDTPDAAARPLSDLPETVFYWPTTPGNILQASSVYTALMAIGFNGLDFAFVSHHAHGQGAAEQVALKSVRDQMLVSRTAAYHWLPALTLPSCLTGRVLRLEPKRMGATPVLTQLSVALDHDLVTDKAGQACWTRGSNGNLLPALTFKPDTFPRRHSPRPSVIVAGMKTSVGGVERLSQNLVQAWRDKFNCIYLALEPTGAAQGDLSADIDTTGALLVNGAEIVSPDRREALLQHLADGYAPKALYLMNGSVWLVNNADLVRNIFADTKIVDQQVYDHLEGWIKHYHKPSIRRFDQFVAVNRKIAEVFETEKGLDPARISYIPHGYDTGPAQHALDHVSRDVACEDYGLDPNKKNILFAGRLVDQKRPLDFLDLAARRKTHPDEHFVLIGDGALADACRTKIRTDGLSNVTMLAYVPGMSRIYRAADALVVTSGYEGLPLVLVEAVCMGVPTVATDVGQIRDVVERFAAGFATAMPGDLDTLDAHLTEVLSAPGTFGQKIKEAQAEFSLARMARRYEAAAQLVKESADA